MVLQPVPVSAAVAIKRLLPEEATSHWAYANPVRAELPSHSELIQKAVQKGVDRKVAEAKIQTFATSRIDTLLLAEQLSHGIVPSMETDRVTLARRLAYDLTGLPPDQQLTEDFLRDENSSAAASEY